MPTNTFKIFQTPHTVRFPQANLDQNIPTHRNPLHSLSIFAIYLCSRYHLQRSLLWRIGKVTIGSHLVRVRPAAQVFFYLRAWPGRSRTASDPYRRIVSFEPAGCDICGVSLFSARSTDCGRSHRMFISCRVHHCRSSNDRLVCHKRSKRNKVSEIAYRYLYLCLYICTYS